MDEGTQTDLAPTVVRFLSESECDTMTTKSLKSAAACELLPNVIGSVALMAPDPSPTPTTTTTTTSAAAATGNTTPKLMLDLGDEIPVGPTTNAAATTSECEATLPNIDMAPMISVYSDSTTGYHSQYPDDDSDEEILNIRLLVNCETESTVDKCPDGLDCPFCGDAPFCASDCESELGEMLQVNRVKDGPLLPATGLLIDTTEKSPAELRANWF